MALEVSFNGWLQVFHHEGPLSTKKHKAMVNYFARSGTLPKLMYSLSLCSLRPVSAAVDNLVRGVQSIKKRLEELNERLNVIRKTVFPIQLNALQSQRRGNTQLRRIPMHRRRLYARRRPQRS